MGEEVLQQNLAPLLAVLEAVERPLLQQSLAAAVHVSVEQAGEPFLQQGVDVIHHLPEQHPAWGEDKQVTVIITVQMFCALSEVTLYISSTAMPAPLCEEGTVILTKLEGFSSSEAASTRQ